jgi:hypothetical protein
MIGQELARFPDPMLRRLVEVTPVSGRSAARYTPHTDTPMRVSSSMQAYLAWAGGGGAEPRLAVRRQGREAIRMAREFSPSELKYLTERLSDRC